MTDKQEPYEMKVVDKRFKESNIEQQSSHKDLVLTAMQKGYEPGFIEKMMDLQERFEANEARKAYHKAMAAFKANPPQIEKDKSVSFGSGKTSYTHASLSNVTTKINMALSAHGLSASWKTEQTNETIKVICSITHELGHSESTSLTASPDTSGSKNAIQAVGSTISYLERYTILALTGLATHDMDDDGNLSGKPVEYINLDMQTEINDLLTATKSDKKKFFEHFNIKSVQTMPMTKYGDVISSLKSKQEQQKKKITREPGEEG